MAPKPKRSVAARSRSRVRDARSVSPPPASASGSGGARARSRSRSPRRAKLDADLKHIDASVAKKLATAVFCCDTGATVPSARESCLVSACGCTHLVLCDRKLCQSHVTPDRECALHHMRKHETSCRDQKHGAAKQPRKVLSYADWAYGSGLEPWPLDRLPVETQIQGEREVFHLRVQSYDLRDELAAGEFNNAEFRRSTAEYDAGQYATLPVRAEDLKAAVLRDMELLPRRGKLEPVDDKTNAVLRKEFVANAGFRERVAFAGADDPQDQPVTDVRLESTLSNELVTPDTYARFLMDCHVDGGMFRTAISIRPLPDDSKWLFPDEEEEDTSRKPAANLKQRYSDVGPASWAILDAKDTPDANVDTYLQSTKLEILTKEELASLPSDVEFRRSAMIQGGPPGRYVSQCPVESRFDFCPCGYYDCGLSTFLWDRFIGSLASPKTKPLDTTTKRLILFQASHAAHMKRRATATAVASASISKR